MEPTWHRRADLRSCTATGEGWGLRCAHHAEIIEKKRDDLNLLSRGRMLRRDTKPRQPMSSRLSSWVRVAPACCLN